MMNPKSAAALMFATMIASISATSAHAFQRHADPGAIEPLVSWTKRTIRVCWRNGADLDPIYEKNDFDSSMRQAVQDIVQQEYTINRVGIEFVGWQNCEELKPGAYDFEIIQDRFGTKANPVVQYYRDQVVEGMAFIGEGGGCYRITETDPFSNQSSVKVGYYYRNSKPEKKMYLLFVELNDIFENSFTSLKRLQSTALHEFGHVAGLRHEHIRAEAMQDENCKYMGTNYSFSEKAYDTTQFVGDYDPNSIMNYCWLATLEAVGLKSRELPNMSDASLYEKFDRVETIKKTVLVGKKPNQRKKVVTVKSPYQEYRLRVGLSERDVAALQELYLKRK
jgi:hypothetical protein